MGNGKQRVKAAQTREKKNAMKGCAFYAGQVTCHGGLDCINLIFVPSFHNDGIIAP